MNKANYKGLEIKAHPDLHKEVFNELKLLNINTDTNILILAGGSGAFEARLFDAGYKNIDVVEINKEGYKFKYLKNKVIQLDLNEEYFFKKINKKYDVIIALEIIEHLYSPFSFLNNIKNLLKDNNSIVIISTPNVHNLFSRINYLLFGLPSYFIVKPQQYDHVSPIFFNVFEHYCELINIEIVKIKNTNSFFKHFKIHSVKSIIYLVLIIILLPFVWIVSIFNRKFLYGTNTIYILRKK